MSFPRYPAYKDSGVEWLGEVPAHWEPTRLRRLVEIKKRIAGEVGHDVLSVTQRGLVVKDIESNDGQLSMDYSKYQLVTPGDFAMNHMDLLTGFVDIASHAGVTSPDYRVFAVRDDSVIDSRFLLRILQMGYHDRILYAFGQGSSLFGRWRLPTEQFNDFAVPVPPLPEQRAIAAFLDRETARIDALVAEQERLIELLREKRQAVISHAVTKGLDPTVPMKDSGVEWLGQVPAHWCVSRCTRHISILCGFPFSSTDFSHDDLDIRLLRGVNVGVGTVKWDDVVYWRRRDGDGLDTYHLSAGALVIGLDRPLVSGGMRVALLSHADVPCLLLQRVASIVPNDGVTKEYVAALLSSPYFIAHFAPETTGVSVPHISPEQIKSFIIPLPPQPEQISIVGYIREQTCHMDALITEAQRAITLLQERRAALISAAVTGQIDVRGFSPEVAA